MQQSIDNLPDIKLYELAINAKHHAEERRDDINKFYISLFSALISITPFVSNITDKIHISFGLTINIFLIILSIIGFSLSISWVLMLKRTNDYLKGIDNFMINTEKDHHKSFITYLSEYLNRIDAPERITKQQMIIPYVFILIFSSMLISTLIYDLLK